MIIMLACLVIHLRKKSSLSLKAMMLSFYLCSGVITVNYLYKVISGQVFTS